MLTHLAIRNIVLIEACELDFAAGLCTLTGETGAGKSILLDALGLVLGARGDASLIRHGETQASVAAEFDIHGNTGAKAVLEELGMEGDDTLLIRRTLNAEGKSRILVNDAPVSVTGLKKLGETLIEIHGQHDQRGLMDQSTHARMLDEYGGNMALRAHVAERYRAWKEAMRALEEFAHAQREARREEEYLRHMVAELQALSPEAGEEETLAEKRSLMMQSEKLFSTLGDATETLEGDKGGIAQIRAAQRVLLRSSLSHTGKFAEAVDQLEKAAHEAELALEALEQLGRESTYDARELEKIEERLFALKAAARKYHVSVDELKSLSDEAEARLKRIDAGEAEQARLQALVKDTQAAYVTQAEALREKRKKAAAALEKAIHAELKPLKMEHTRVRARIEPLPESQWHAGGMDQIAFEVATNVVAGREAPPYSALGKIASGGELSRFMLAMKVALSVTKLTPTMIFDEIDTGTGGAVADAIGQRLALLGKTAQVLVVTHLPQVAAKAAQHLKVEKTQAKGKGVVTRVTPLDTGEREEELARMLAGATITPEARKAAQKLLETVG